MWLANQAGGAAVGVLVGAAIGAWLLVPADKPSIAEQLDGQLQQASKHGFLVSVNRIVHLHGTGVRSRLLVLEPKRADFELSSDEVRVYDERGNDLKLRYVARPRRVAKRPGYRFRVLGVGRYDDSDREEVIASLDQRFADSRPPHPVALVWNLSRQRYEMQPLLPSAPRMPKMKPGAWGRATRAFYRRSDDVGLNESLVLRSLRGASTVRVARGTLVAGYIASSPCNACGGTWVFVPWGLDFQHPGYARQQRDFGHGDLTIRVDSPGDIPRAERRLLRRSLG